RPLALSRTALRPGLTEAGARLPVSLLDFRPGRRRLGAVRAGGPAAPAAAAPGRPAGRAARRRQLLRPGRTLVVGSAHEEGAAMIRRIVRFVDRRSGSAPLLRKALRYAFPDHWSFLLGEVALYCFLVLVATGVYLTFFFKP